MKRDPRLIEFSREHHTALKLGNKLKNINCIDAGNIALEMHRTLLLDHFTEEEVALNTIIASLDPSIGDRFHQDHQTLRSYLKKGVLTLPELKLFGELLIAHTRFEERELFQLIQQQWA